MESLAYIVLGSLLLFHVLSSLLQRRRKLKLPPGPKPWPIVGSIHLLRPFFHHSIYRLSQKYGPIMYLQLGSYPVIIVSSVNMAKQFLKFQDQNFSYRPKSTAGRHLFYDYCNITFAPYGPYWRHIRKISQEELLSSTQLSSQEHIRHQEMKSLLLSLLNDAGQPVAIKRRMSMAGFNIICRSMLGKKYLNQTLVEQEVVAAGELPKMLDDLFLLTGVLNVGDLVPWINWLDLQGWVKKMRMLRRKFDRLLDYILEDIEKGEPEARTMVHVLLKHLEDSNREYDFTKKHIKAVIQDMIGGIETCSAVAEWAMSELLKHHECLRKATQELDVVIGKKRLVEEKDLPDLPYLGAITKETMRLHPVGPMLAPRTSHQDCTIAGYDIPAKTRVFINVWSIVRSLEVWDEPEEFIPERFLNSNIDIIGQNFELLPFGSGRRMCPGYNLGMKTVTLYLANLLHGFSWKLEKDMTVNELNMEEEPGLTMPRKVPLVMVVEPRLPINVYHL